MYPDTVSLLALLMASARAYLRQRTSLPGSLSQIITDVNCQLTVDVADSNSFMTLFCLKSIGSRPC